MFRILLTVGLVALAAAAAANPDDFVFDVKPREVAPGETAVLHWSIKGAKEITIEASPESGAARGRLHPLGTFEGGSGSLEVKPAEDTTYIISCEGLTTYACASLTVRVRVKKR